MHGLWSFLPPAPLDACAASGIQRARARAACFLSACRKIKDGYPSGELTLKHLDTAGWQETLRILRNLEEEQARSKNPLERIMRIAQTNGEWKIETTTEKLAQRLGRSLGKARGGKLAYKWGHNNKFLRVVLELKSE